MSVVPAVWIPYPRPAASVELRCGVLYRGCQCVKRDGLQQDCPRSQCQGRPSCLDYPAPSCGPSGNHHNIPNSACDHRPDNASSPNTSKYLSYKRKLDKIYKRSVPKGFIENPPINPRNSIPCSVHKNDD